jgi:phage-related protein
MAAQKPIVFLGDSLDQLRDFPDSARQDMGRELARVQEGRDPLDWKPMPTVGRGVREIRVSDRAGEFRSIYVASLGDEIYVLHAFQKKSQKTPQRDINLAAKRYKSI